MSARDTMTYVEPYAAPESIPVSPPEIERLRLDSTAVAELETLVRWKDTVIVAQDRRITADSLELLATSRAF